MMVEGCISCATVSGLFVPPGGIVFEHPKWVVVLRAHPVRLPCLPLIILKRHIEDVAYLDQEESSSLGPLIQLTAQALDHVLHPVKVHFGIYAENVKHIHMHVFPRMPNMPPGNLPNQWINLWADFLQRLHLRKPYSDEIVGQYAETLRVEYSQLVSS